MEHLAVWVATAMAAKILADVLRRAYGFDIHGRIASARRGIETDPAYVLAYAIALLVVRAIGLDAALLVAIVLRASAIVGDRVVLASNHACLELYVAVVCLQLNHDPAALASVLQVIGVAVWVLAAYQKLYHREYLNGIYYYLSMHGEEWRLGRWTSFVQEVPEIDGDHGALDARALKFCRTFALMVLLGESVPPLLGFSLNGTPWGVLCLLAVALPVGLSSKETNFMITNILLAAVLLLPFQGSAFVAGMRDPVVAVVTALCVVWPVFHASLSRMLRVTPWKLAGWGMYSSHKPRVNVVLPGGELRPLTGKIPARVVLEFGACRIGWVRDAIRRYYFRWDFTAPAAALAFRWYRVQDGGFVTHCAVVRNAPGAPVQTFEITDEASGAAFERYLSSLTLAPAAEPLPRVAVAAAAAV